LLSPAAGTLQPEETAASTLAAGLVSLQVLTHLDGVTEPATAEATLEIEMPDGLIARRSWPPHPSCGCHWPPQPTTNSPNRPTYGDHTVTMSDQRRSAADHRADEISASARIRPLTRTMEP
jgi:hypothetical protein